MNYNKPDISDIESDSENLSISLFNNYLKLQEQKISNEGKFKVINLLIDFYKLKYTVQRDFKSEMNMNLNDNKIKLIIIPIQLVYNNNSHYNILIINKINNTFEYFEPMGEIHYYEIPYFKILNHILGITGYTNKFKFIDIHKSCPSRQGLQYKQELIFKDKYGPLTESNLPFGYYGFCVAWCLLCAHLRILNPTIDINTIITHILKNNTPDQLDSYIRRYIHLIEKTKFILLPNTIRNIDFNVILTKSEIIKNKKLLLQFKNNNDKKSLLFIHFPFYDDIMLSTDDFQKKIKQEQLEKYILEYHNS